jgi:glycerol uptake facilitator-like aquaporin
MPPRADLARRAVAEALGTALLLAAVVGSGIMAERLAGGNVALALLANIVATGAALVALILTFGAISGAHFNPAVTLADASQLAVIWGGVRRRVEAVPFAIGAYITAAYWFTSSTSFANPAVTLARAASDTFAGIRPADAPGLIVAQLAGAAVPTLAFRWLVPALPKVADRVADRILPEDMP